MERPESKGNGFKITHFQETYNFFLLYRISILTQMEFILPKQFELRNNVNHISSIKVNNYLPIQEHIIVLRHINEKCPKLTFSLLPMYHSFFNSNKDT